jgi:hypothetical protein
MSASFSKMIWIAVLIAIQLPSIHAAEKNRKIIGKVTDNKGQPIVDATVRFQIMGIIRDISIRTDKDGSYVYTSDIKDGKVRAIIRAKGFKTAWEENITENGKATALNIQLQPGDSLFDPSTTVNPDPDHLSRIANLINQDNFDEAIKEAHKGLVEMYAQIGDCKIRQGKYEEAREAYWSGMKYQPDNINLLLGMSFALDKLGRSEEAKEYFSKAEKDMDAKGKDMKVIMDDAVRELKKSNPAK